MVVLVLVAAALVCGGAAGLAWAGFRNLVILASAAGVVFVAIWWMVGADIGLARADEAVATWAADHATDLSISVWKVVTALGSTPVIVTLAIVVAVVESARRPASRAWVPAFVAVVVVGQNLASSAVKHAAGRARPDVGPLVEATGFSFPSGHATAAAACLLAFALLAARGRSRAAQVVIYGVAGAAAGAVAASRVMLGVHWLTDVVAGLALGCAWFAACAAGLVWLMRPLGRTPPGAPAATGTADP